MPTLAEMILADRKRGVPAEKTAAQMKALGMEPEDGPLEYGAAKAKGAARLSAKVAPLKFPPYGVDSPFATQIVAMPPLPKTLGEAIGAVTPKATTGAYGLPLDDPRATEALEAIGKVPERGDEIETPLAKIPLLPVKAYSGIEGLQKALGLEWQPATDEGPMLGTSTLALRPDMSKEARDRGAAARAPIMEAIAKQRKERALPEGFLAGGAQWMGNSKDDIVENLVGLVEMINEVAGFTIVPKGDTFAAKVKRSSEFGEAVGTGFVAAPLALIKGLFDHDGMNSLQTHPFSIWRMFVDAARQAGMKQPKAVGVKLDAAKDYFRTKVAEPVVQGFFRDEAGLPNWAPKTVAAIQRALVDGATNGVKHITAIMEKILHDPQGSKASIINDLERIGRQYEQRGVELVRPDLVETQLAGIPRDDFAATKAATREATQAEAAAGKATGQAEMAAETSAEAIEVAQQVRNAQRKAEKSQAAIVKGVQEQEIAAIREKLGEQQASQRAQEISDQGERLASRARGEAADQTLAGLEAADTALESAKGIDNPRGKAKAQLASADRELADVADRAEIAADLRGIPAEVRAENARVAGEIPWVESELAQADFQLRAQLLQKYGKDQIRRVMESEQFKRLVDDVAEVGAEAKRAQGTVWAQLARAERLLQRAATAEATTVARLRVAADNWARQRGRHEARQTKAAGKVAAVGIDAAETTKTLTGHEEAAAKARETRNSLGSEARGLERRATNAALAVEDAGPMPQVEAGKVWVPERNLVGDPPQVAGEKLVYRDDRSSVVGQQGDLHDLLPEVPKGRRLTIEQAGAEASTAKKAAVAAGFEPDVQPNWAAENNPASIAQAKSLFVEWKRRQGLPPDADMYAVGRHIADYLHGRNAAEPARMAEMLRQIGAKKGLADAAAWLLAEADFGKKAQMIEQSFGARRRPTAEVTEWQVTPLGGLIKMPETRRLDLVRAATLPEVGTPRDARKYLHEMASRQLPDEAPRATRTTNPIINAAIEGVAAELRKAYYPDEATPAHQRSQTQIEADVGMPAPDFFVSQADQHKKMVTQETVAQRILEAFDDDTTQTLRSKTIRNAAVNLFRDRAAKAGLTGKALRSAAEGFLRQLEDPIRTGPLSKSRFIEVFGPQGEPLFTRADMAGVNQKASRKVKADVMRAIGDEIAEAAFGYNTLGELAKSLYQGMTLPDGTPDPAIVGSVANFARHLADGILGKKESPPAMMPFSGDDLAGALRKLRQDVDLPYSAAQIDALAKWFEKYQPAAASGGLSETIGSWWKNAYRSTEPPPTMVNVHVEPGALASLRGHFASLSSAEAPGVMGLIRAMGQQTKKALVALNVPSLLNNNQANLIVQAIRRADPLMPIRAVQATMAYKAFRDGTLDNPRLVRIFKAIDETDMLGQSDLAIDIGKSDIGKQLEVVFPGIANARRKLSVASRDWAAVPADAIAKVNDTLAKSYTELGDKPFRLEESLAAYDAFERKTAKLRPGEWVDLQTGVARSKRIERTEFGYTITDMSGPHATRKAGLVDVKRLDGPEATKAFAEAANFAQEKPFFNYSRIGNWGKYLRGGPLSLVSGIFSWTFKAIDFPGLKRGILSEMMSAPHQVKTNSPAVLAMQHGENFALSIRRAMLTGTALAAASGQRGLEDLRRMAGYNQTSLGSVLKYATNPMGLDGPRQMWVKNVDPVLSTGPSAVVWGLGQWLMTKAAFNDVFDEPEEMIQMIRPDAELTPSQRQAKRLVMQLAKGETFAPKQAFQMLGLAGGPLLTLMERMRNSGERGKHISGHEAINEFGKMMFGSTLVKTTDVGIAGLAKVTGSDSLMEWSSYGKDFAKQGFHGGQPASDESGFARWALRQIVGAGYSRINVGDAKNVETGGDLHGRLQNYLANAKVAAKTELLGEAKRRNNLAAQEYGANSPEHKAALKVYNTLDDVIDKEFKAYKKNLDAQFQALKTGATPAPKSTLDSKR